MQKIQTPALKSIAPKQVATLRRRYMGASRRKTRLEQQQKALAQKIRAKGVFVENKGQRTFIALSVAQLTTAKVDLQMNRVDLRSAVTDLVVAKREFTAAVAAVRAVKTTSHKSRVAAIKVAPVIPELVEKVVAALGKARSNGSKEAVEHLIASSQSGTKKEFTPALDAILTVIDKALLDEVNQGDGLIKGKVVSRVMTQLKKKEKTTQDKQD